jgi:hypothetical protein
MRRVLARHKGVHPGCDRISIDGGQEFEPVGADLVGQHLGGGVLAAQEPGGFDLPAVAFVPPFLQQGHDEGEADPGDGLQRGPQRFPDRLDPIQPAHAGDDVR